jgi:hypothetical protein
VQYYEHCKGNYTFSVRTFRVHSSITVGYGEGSQLFLAALHCLIILYLLHRWFFCFFNTAYSASSQVPVSEAAGIDPRTVTKFAWQSDTVTTSQLDFVHASSHPHDLSPSFLHSPTVRKSCAYY